MANPADCQRTFAELNRLQEKLDQGDELTPSEEEWAVQQGVELKEAADVGVASFKRGTIKALWPFAAFFGALYLLKGKI